VAEINIQAKARMTAEGRAPLRDQLISRPELLGRLGSPISPAANLALRLAPARWLLEKAVGIHRRAPMPAFLRGTFLSRLRNRVAPAPPPSADRGERTVAYFYGCGTNYYEPDLGEQAVRILEMAGCRVILPRQRCCGLPLQSNGLFDAARKCARDNIEWLAPFASAGIPILGTSTSCTLSLKHDYRAILGVDGAAADAVAEGTFDLFEYLTLQIPEALSRLELFPVRARAIYHAPCQLRAHGIGTPALEVLRRIPGLRIDVSDAECCGVAGTYGLKREKFDVALAVGKGLLDRVREGDFDFVITDSETCRWWIAGHSGVPAYHPAQVLARSLEIV
jgi:glycerol-3-phosphate dehydrogenase subunit C